MNILWELELHNFLSSSHKTITYNYRYLRTAFHGVYDINNSKGKIPNGINFSFKNIQKKRKLTGLDPYSHIVSE